MDSWPDNPLIDELPNTCSPHLALMTLAHSAGASGV